MIFFESLVSALLTLFSLFFSFSFSTGVDSFTGFCTGPASGCVNFFFFALAVNTDYMGLARMH